MLCLEHVNINIGAWTPTIENFYFSALGFQNDPRGDMILAKDRGFNASSSGRTWANIGLQQFHLPWEDPQIIRGRIGLVYPSLELLASRLRKHSVHFDVRQLDSRVDDNYHDSDSVITEVIFDLKCPIGNNIRIHEYAGTDIFPVSEAVWFGPGYDFPIAIRNDNELSLERQVIQSGFPVEISTNLENRELTVDNYYNLSAECHLPGGVSMGLGIKYIDFDVPVDAAHSICGFYAHYFNADTQTNTIYCPDSDKSCIPLISAELPDLDIERMRKQCIVKVGKSQRLIFTELLAGQTSPPYDGHHIAIYVSEFSAVYNRLASYTGHHLLWNNPRFMRTASHDLQGALEHSEFRIKDIIDIETSEIIYELEHEIRSVEHPSFCCKACAAKIATRSAT